MTILLFALPELARGDGDLPPPEPRIETVAADSLVIPMDNDKQNIGTPFNLKAYGLVQRLLKANVPVKWVIRAGKAKDAIDFSATAESVLPTPAAATMVDFRGGPFVIEARFATQALDIASAYGNNVAVYRLTAPVEVDVRYTLTQRAFVLVANDDNHAAIHTAMLTAAGFMEGEDYAVLARPTNAAQLNSSTCATIVTGPHYDGGRDANYDAVVGAVREFLLSGGNVLAQCKAVKSYENHGSLGFFQTTAGIMKPNDPRTSLTYPAPDMPFSQFVGPVADRGGAIPRFGLASGSVFHNGGHVHVQYSAANPAVFKATVAKLGSTQGSLIFYLAGHEYPGSDLKELNGQRMYLNAVLHPARRPAQCGFDFATPTATVPTMTPTASATPTVTVPTMTPTASAAPTATVPAMTPTARVTPTPNLCGNGDLDPGETCDDGNRVNGDCCSADCRLEPLGAPCDDGLSCTSGDHCDGLGVCRSESSTGQYAILRWSPGDPLGSFTTVLGRRALVGGHVCTDMAKLGGSARVLGDLVGLMTANNALYFGKRTQVAGTVVTAGGSVIGAENAQIGEFRGADSSGGAAELSDCALARARTLAAHSALAGLPPDGQAQFGFTKVRSGQVLRVPATGTSSAGTAVVDFEDLKLGSSATLELVAGPNTRDAVVRVRNRLRLGARARVTLTGLRPNQVVFLVGGATNVGASAYLPGTLMGGDRITVRRRAVVEGGLFGKTVLVSGSARVQRAGWVGWCR